MERFSPGSDPLAPHRDRSAVREKIESDVKLFIKNKGAIDLYNSYGAIEGKGTSAAPRKSVFRYGRKPGVMEGVK